MYHPVVLEIYRVAVVVPYANRRLPNGRFLASGLAEFLGHVFLADAMFRSGKVLKVDALL